jgi:CheY-like chemotaxis protein
MKENIMSAPRKVLVVDDDPVVGKSFDRVLSGKGYAVITARNGEEALSKISNEKYDVVFTDIKMPGISGLEVAERIKASQPWLPVVIVTGYGSDAYEARAEAAGVSGFLRKPLSPDMIEGSTDKALLERDATLPSPAAVAEVIPAELEAAKKGSTARNIALFFAAPFIGLAYILAMPFVGLGMLGWFAAKASMTKVKRLAPAAKHIGLLFSAPVVGLVFILAIPFAGLALLAWFGTGALLGR